MASLTPVFDEKLIEDETALRIWATEALVMDFVTRNQCREIIDHFAPMLPLRLAMSCRTPKGVIYCYLRGPTEARRLVHRIGPRAKWMPGADSRSSENADTARGQAYPQAWRLT